MANGFSRSILLLSVCLLGLDAHPQALGFSATPPQPESHTVKFVREWSVAEGTHVFVVFDDGAAYHSLLPKDSSSLPACSEHRQTSLSLLSAYDYAGMRRTREPDITLDAAEVARRWSTVADQPVEYEVQSRARLHGGVSCMFAVTGKPTARLTELRLMNFDSMFFRVLPRSSEQRATESWLGQALYEFSRKVSAPSR